MPTPVLISLIALGLLAGYLSGLIGIGGAVIIIPALVFLFKMDQHMAQGTTLALMVPPIGILAVINYYKKGFVDIKVAIFIALGFIIGGYFGSFTSVHLSTDLIRKIFALLLVLIAAKMFFS